jgi:hypothetical protein
VLKQGNQTAHEMLRSLYGFAATEYTSRWELGGIMTAAAVTGALGAIVTPVVATAAEEGHFASEASQTQSSS